MVMAAPFPGIDKLRRPQVIIPGNRVGTALMSRWRTAQPEGEMRMHRRAAAPLPIGAAILAGLLFAAGPAPAPAADPAKPESSCIACHTDSARLTEEAKGLPQPAASALQAGKG
jgi:hypothetical protein